MSKALAENRRARFDYQIDESFETGIVLDGKEVKAAKFGKVNLAGSYGRILMMSGNPELWLVGTHIGVLEGDQTRSRKLLVHKDQLNKLIGKTQEKGYTLIPLRMYVVRGYIKIELGIGKGKKAFDKRAKIKERDIERGLRRKEI